MSDANTDVILARLRDHASVRAGRLDQFADLYADFAADFEALDASLSDGNPLPTAWERRTDSGEVSA